MPHSHCLILPAEVKTCYAGREIFPGVKAYGFSNCCGDAKQVIIHEAREYGGYYARIDLMVV